MSKRREDRSLIQWVVAQGGLKPDPAMAGEIERIRCYNRWFRGRCSVVSPRGEGFDLLAILAREEGGFRIHDAQHFLDALEMDARAWLEGTERHRVRPMWAELDDDLTWKE